MGRDGEGEPPRMVNSRRDIAHGVILEVLLNFKEDGSSAIRVVVIATALGPFGLCSSHQAHSDPDRVGVGKVILNNSACYYVARSIAGLEVVD